MIDRPRNSVISLAATALLAAGGIAWFGRAPEPIRLGLLHSQTGPMAISEKPMLEAELLAIAEINEAGGINGRLVEAVIADGRSDSETFAREARRLVVDEKVCSIVGCWTSAHRKMVRAVVEKHKNVLIYPMAFEGMELSPNIVYVGAAANQQVIPAVKWALESAGKRVFLVGSDYIWPHLVNEVAKDQLATLGAAVVGEEYVPFGTESMPDVLDKIVRARPDAILSTIVGDSNLPFYQGLYERGVKPGQSAVISLSIGAPEVKQIPLPYIVNHYSAWSYFQDLDLAENAAFVANFRNRYGADRQISDVAQSAYVSVHLWKQAVLEVGSDSPSVILESMRGQSLNAPEGIVSIDKATRYAWRSFCIGRVNDRADFDIVWNAEKPIRPVPYPHSRARSDWDQLTASLYSQWGNQWVNPNRAMR